MNLFFLGGSGPQFRACCEEMGYGPYSKNVHHLPTIASLEGIVVREGDFVINLDREDPRVAKALDLAAAFDRRAAKTMHRASAPRTLVGAESPARTPNNLSIEEPHA